jgi:hypothetical protein
MRHYPHMQKPLDTITHISAELCGFTAPEDAARRVRAGRHGQVATNANDLVRGDDSSVVF